MKKSSKDEGEPHDVEAVAHGLGIRHVQIAVMSMAAFVAYSLQANLSVAIVAMVEVQNDTHTTVPLAPTYDWDEQTQGYVLSSFFWGYLITQIPAGILSDRFGGHQFLCGAVLGSSLLSIIFPQCAYLGGWMLVCVNRMLQGLSQGFVFPSIFTLLGLWAPPSERSMLASLSTGAQLLGTVASTPLTGFLCSFYGWPSVFYVLGAFGTAASIVMFFLGADSPSTHRMISQEEKSYICTSLGGAKVNLEVPWKLVFKNIPYWAATITMAFEALVYFMFLTKAPTFLGTVLKFSMADIGILSAAPFLVSWLLTFVFSWLCDLLVCRGWLKLTPARKLFNSIAHFGGAICMLLLPLSQDKIISVVLLTAFMGTQAGSFVGVMAGFVDLAPNFSGAIYSISNFAAISLSVCGPIIVGCIVTQTGSAEQWGHVFYLCAAVLILSNVVYLIWGTADTQWWNWPDKYKGKKEYKQNRDRHTVTALSASKAEFFGSFMRI